MEATPMFLPGESQGRGSLVGCRLWGRTESDTTEATCSTSVYNVLYGSIITAVICAFWCYVKIFFFPHTSFLTAYSGVMLKYSSFLILLSSLQYSSLNSHPSHLPLLNGLKFWYEMFFVL